MLMLDGDDGVKPEVSSGVPKFVRFERLGPQSRAFFVSWCIREYFRDGSFSGERKSRDESGT